MTRRELKRARRLVVKVGTSLLTSPDGDVHARRFSQLADDVAELMVGRRQVVLVASGAVGLGVQRLGGLQRSESCVRRRRLRAGYRHRVFFGGVLQRVQRLEVNELPETFEEFALHLTTAVPRQGDRPLDHRFRTRLR